MHWIITASVKLWRVLTFHGDLYKPTELLHKSVVNTLLLQQHQHHQQDEYRCLLYHAPCFVCRRVIWKIIIYLFTNCVIINFIFPHSAECGNVKCYKKDRRECIAHRACDWKERRGECTLAGKYGGSGLGKKGQGAA